MRADKTGHAKALRASRPGPLPSQAQMDAWHSRLKTVTQHLTLEP
jgi:hypothetical protein